METVGNSNSITETDVATEFCMKVQADENVIHVEESTNFYTHLRFSLLASTWFPRPLGLCLWSGMHMFLVFYEALLLLVLYPTIFVLAVLMDVFIKAQLLYMVLIFPLIAITAILGVGIAIALAWLWLVITCQCCTMPGRAPGQSLGNYIFTAGRTPGPRPQDPQPAPVVEGGGVAAEEPCAFMNTLWRYSCTLNFVNYVIQVSFPYRRAQLRNLCREIVPWYDTVVI